MGKRHTRTTLVLDGYTNFLGYESNMHVIISRIQFFSIYGILHISGGKHSSITCNYVYSHARHSYWYLYLHVNVITALDMDSRVIHMHIR
jgi:hypothetical protein